MSKLFNKAIQVTIHFWCQFRILKNLGLLLSIFSSSESFYFKLPPRLRCIKIRRKFVKIVIFLQCNGI